MPKHWDASSKPVDPDPQDAGIAACQLAWAKFAGLRRGRAECLGMKRWRKRKAGERYHLRIIVSKELKDDNSIMSRYLGGNKTWHEWIYCKFDEPAGLQVQYVASKESYNQSQTSKMGSVEASFSLLHTVHLRVLCLHTGSSAATWDPSETNCWGTQLPLVRGVAVELCNLRAGAAYNGLSGGFTTSEMVIETSTSNLPSIEFELGMDPYAFSALHWRPSFHMFFNYGFAIYGDFFLKIFQRFHSKSEFFWSGVVLSTGPNPRGRWEAWERNSAWHADLIHTHRIYILYISAHEFTIL